MTLFSSTPGVILLLWGCLVLLFLLLLLLISYLIVQARRTKHPSPAIKAETQPKDDAIAVNPALAAEFPDSFSGAISTLRSRVSGSDFRYRLPWYLLIGPQKSGKTSLLAESSLSVALEEQVRVEQGAGLAWNFFENGIVIDVGGWAFSTASSAVSTWRRLLRLFLNHRPERPLDGILLAFSITDLTGPAALSPPTLIERGALLQQRLRQLTQTIGFQLPIYLVLTKADAIHGFTEFTTELDSSELEQIFGWSNPHGNATEFRPEWVDEAINVMRISLERKQSRLFARHEPNAARGPMFLFPGALYELIPNLRLLLSRALRGGNDLGFPMLRGIYCCGATSPHVRRVETSRLVPVSAPATSIFPSAFDTGGRSWVPDLLEPWLRSDLRIAFTQELLLKKIFVEKGLAVPLPQHFALRDRMRVTLQVASAAVALVLATGTAFSYRRDIYDRNNLVPLLTTIKTDLRSPPSFNPNHDPSANRASASSLIHAMASFETDGFRSIFIPASWFDPINASVSKAMVPAFRVLVLQRFYQGLQFRIRIIADLNRKPLVHVDLPPAGVSVQPALQLERTPEFLQMRAFIEQITEFQHFVDIYNNLSSNASPAPISSIIELDEYLHNQTRSVPQTEASNPYFEQALREATWSPMVYTEESRRQMSFKASQLSTALYSSWIEHNPTRTATEHLVASIDTIGAQSRQSYANLTDTKAAFDTLSKTLADPELAWTGADRMELPTNLASVTTAAVTRFQLFQPWLHDWMLDLADEDFRKLASAIDLAQTPLTGTLLKSEDGKLHLSERALQVQIALENLMKLPFMSPGATLSSISPHIDAGNFTWNKASLDTAATLPVSYERYLSEDLDQAPTALHSAFSRIATEQLSDSLVVAIDEAKQPAPPLPSLQGDSDLFQQVQTFASTESSISALLATMQENSLSTPLSQLQRAATRQATNLLLALDRELDAGHPFGVSTTALTRWTLDGTPTSEIFDAPTPDAIAAYLAAQSSLVETYSAAAAPLVNFLHPYSSGLPPRTAKVLARWEGITTAVDQNKAKRPGNSIQLIEDFIAAGADKITPARACQSPAPFMVAARSQDYFNLGVSELRRDILARCQVLLSESFSHSYTLVATRFNRDLAGRFPFASGSSSLLYEADPALVANLFSQRDAAGDLFDAGSASHQEVKPFLDAMQMVRPWFGSLLTTASSTQVPSLDFVPSLRVDKTEEIGGNQIIDWTLTVGSESFQLNDPERKGHWTYGDPIVLSLRWAKDAPFQPTAAQVQHPGYDLQVVGNTVIYTFKDPWSLLRFVRTFSRIPDASGNANGFTLAFNIAESSGNGARLQAEPVTSARVFLRLLISAPGAKQTIQTDNFPEAAPLLLTHPPAALPVGAL